MDKNKLKQLREISYKIIDSCGICEYGYFPSSSLFGECIKHTYYHLKHKKTRYLSIHRHGVCENGFKSDKDPNRIKLEYDLYYKQLS